MSQEWIGDSLHLAESTSALSANLPDDWVEDATVLQVVPTIGAMMAPIRVTLANVASYLDPTTAPDAFLPWLAYLIGLGIDDVEQSDRRRELLARGVDVHMRRRGTASGLVALIQLLTGYEVELVESGGVTWSSEYVDPEPGAEAWLVVRVHGDDVDAARLDAVVAAAKPAHVQHRVEIVT